MSAITFGFPSTDGLLCEDFSCKDPAEFIAHIGFEGSPTTEVCGCKAHITQLITGKHVLVMDKLETPGNRNIKVPAKK